MIHAAHAAHAHIIHAKGRAFPERWHRCPHSEPWCKRGMSHPRAVDTLGHQRVGLVLGLNDDVVGLGIADLEFVHAGREMRARFNSTRTIVFLQKLHAR